MNIQNSPDKEQKNSSYKTRIYRAEQSTAKPTTLVYRAPKPGTQRPGHQPKPMAHIPPQQRHSRGGQPPTNYHTNQQEQYRRPTLRRNYEQRPPFESGMTMSREQSRVIIPPVEPGVIRIIPICGVEWIGTNMTAIEYENDIVVVDAGFGFKNPDTPGINYTIPDTKYLEENKHKIRALIITHGHMDHVGGIPYVIEKIGNPPIYTRQFGAMFIEKRMEEFPQVPKLDIHVIDADAGYIPLTENFKVKFFGLTHSIPDSTGVILQTPLGGIVSTGDVRVENTDGIPSQDEIDQYAFFKNENIIVCTMDSTGIKDPGWAISEMKVRENIDALIRDVQGRLFIGSFSSQVERLMAFIDSAKKYGRYVVIDGRSMKSNLGIAEFLELTKFDHVVPIEDMNNYPPDKLMILVTGAQGEQYSALDRASKGNHKFIKLLPTDTVILSSSVVPGNDYSVDKLKDELYRTGARIVTYSDNVVHASGHGKREELRWIHQQIPYKFFVPVHGRHWFLRLHAKLAEEMGVPHENIVVPENGSIIEIRDGGNSISVRPEKAVDVPCWIVDGAYIGPLQEVVMDDRKKLAENGMFIVMATLDLRRKTLLKSPDIVSRGFVYLRESRDLLNRIRTLVKRTCEAYMETNHGEGETDILKKVLADRVSKYLFQKTQKEPIVIPVIVTVG